MCLRKELQPAGEAAAPYTDHRAMHALAALLLRPPTTNRAITTDNPTVIPNSIASSRSNLLLDIQALLPPTLLIPEARLEELLEQALMAQLDKSHYHNAGHLTLSLFSDYTAGPDQLPSVQAAVLEEDNAGGTGHTDEVWSLCFSHNGQYLASSSKDGTAILWQVGVGRVVKKVKVVARCNTGPINVVAFSPDDTTLLVAGSDFTIRLHSVPNGREVLKLTVPNSTQRHTNGSGIESQGLAAAAAAAAATGSVLDNNNRGCSCDAINAVAWFPSGQFFLVALLNKLILIYSKDGTLIRKIKQPGHVYDAAVSRDGTTIVAVTQHRASHAAGIRFFRLVDGREATVCEPSSAVTCISMSPDGRFMLANLASHTIHLWPMGDLGVRGATSATGGDVLMNNNGHNGGGSGGGGTFSMRPGGSDPLDAIPPTAKQEYKMEDTQPGRYIIRSTMGGAGCGFVASGSENGNVYIWHRESGELLNVLKGHSGTVNTVAWNPRDHYMLASAADDHTIRIWLAAAAM